MFGLFADDGIKEKECFFYDYKRIDQARRYRILRSWYSIVIENPAVTRPVNAAVPGVALDALFWQERRP